MTAQLPAGSYHFSRIGIAKCAGIGFEVYPGEDAVDLGEIRVNFNWIEYPSRIELSGIPEKVPSKIMAEGSAKTKITAVTDRTFWIASDAHCYASIDHTGTAIAKGVITVGLVVGLIVLLGLSAIGQGSVSGPFFER